MNKIESARTAAGMTQIDLARNAKLTQSLISQYENGKKMPGVPTLKKIAEALKVDISELI